MNTIFWIAMALMVYGYGMFILSVITFIMTLKGMFSFHDKLLAEAAFNHGGWGVYIRFKELGMAIICTIIVCTL